MKIISITQGCPCKDLIFDTDITETSTASSASSAHSVSHFDSSERNKLRLCLGINMILVTVPDIIKT